MGGLVWPEPASLGYLLIMGLLVLPVSTALITLGPRYLTAPEVSLILLLETVLGPLWVWAVLDQMPPAATFVGGSIVLVTLAVHAILGLRRSSAGGAQAAASPPAQ